MRALWSFIAAAALAAPAAANTRVLDAVDGNTVIVQGADGTPQRVRLAGIEAPVLCQPWGPEARDALREWAKDQPVTLKGGGKPGAGPLVAAVLLDGADLGRRMVEEGHAWSTRTKWDQGPFVKQERMAKALRRGLHADPSAITPQDWRRQHAPC